MAWIQTGDPGLPALRLSYQDWKITVIPGLGGKISSLCWRDEELLAVNPRKPFRPARYAAPYAEFDASGFDECFPTIGPCVYPDDPWSGAPLPDHGELWSQPWLADHQDNSLTLQVSGVRLPYVFSKTISFPDSGAVQFHYQVSNPTSDPIHFLWSSHPLLSLQPGMRILLPADTRVRVDWSRDARLGEIWQEHPWPQTTDTRGNPVDLSAILGPETGWVDKLYTFPLKEGWCALFNPGSSRYAAFTFSAHAVPYVGLSINLGGWPVDEPGYYNLGLEPCSGYPDRLDLARSRGGYSTLGPYLSREWDLFFHAGLAASEAALRQSLGQLSRSLSDDQQMPDPGLPGDIH